MDSNTQTGPEPVAGRTFSLATMLLLTTVVAIFLASARVFIVEENMLKGDLAAARALAGVVIGLVVGVIVALRRQRRALGVVLAVLLGAPVGGAAAMLLAEPLNLQVCLGGAIVLILLGAAVRAFSAKPPAPPPK